MSAPPAIDLAAFLAGQDAKDQLRDSPEAEDFRSQLQGLTIRLVNGQTVPLYLRGERGELDHGAYPFEHEARVLKVMESEGLPVPHIYGMVPDPCMIVMDKMPGRIDLSTAEDEAERVSVLNHYVDLLADLHAIDPKRFEEIGVDKPADARAVE